MAQWLKARPEVAAVLHPALADCPGHEFFERDFKGGAGGLFSIVFDKRYSAAQVDAFVEALELFGYRLELGRFAQPCHAIQRSGRCARRVKWPHEGVLVRFFVGLEDEADLRGDIDRALVAAFG